jgi:hypothetical protein
MQVKRPNETSRFNSWPSLAAVLAALFLFSLWSFAQTDEQTLERLIQQLGRNRFFEREAATKALNAMGEPALGALRRAAQSSNDAETRRRARDLIFTIEKRIAERDRARVAGLIRRVGGSYAVTQDRPGEPVWRVDLSHTKVCDGDLIELRGLKELQVLILFDTRITDAGLAHLEELRGLRALDLSDTAVTSDGLIHIRKLIRLKDLTLIGTKVTDTGLVNLESHHDLWLLDLSGTKVTDRGLAHLRQLRKLSHLHLSKTSVTDSSMGTLIELPAIEVIDLSQTKVTEAGIAAFQNVKIGVRIER